MPRSSNKVEKRRKGSSKPSKPTKTSGSVFSKVLSAMGMGDEKKVGPTAGNDDDDDDVSMAASGGDGDDASVADEVGAVGGQASDAIAVLTEGRALQEEASQALGDEAGT